MGTDPDFSDLLQSLCDARVRFLVVGAHALIYHTEPRYTKDFDIWVEPSSENTARLWRSLAHFGAPLAGLREEDFADPDMMFQIGIEPHRIDIMMGIDGLTFEKAWKNRVRTSYGGIPIYVLSKPDLIRAKRAAGRPQDLLDVKSLLDAGKKRRPKRKRK